MRAEVIDRTENHVPAPPRFGSYAEYQSHPIRWLSSLPRHWTTKRIKHTTYVKGRIGWQNLRSDEFVDEGPFCVTGTDFDNGKIRWERSYHVSPSRYAEDSYIQLRDGDLLITKDGSIGKVALVQNLPDLACLNSGLFVTRPLRNEYYTSFLYWVLASDVFTHFIDYMKSGSTIQHLYQNVFVEFAFPVPPLDEQRVIAAFLQDQTARIDELIAKKRQLIARLAMKREARIADAVAVETKDSVRYTIKRLVRFTTSGSRGWAEFYADEGDLFIQSGNLNRRLGLDLTVVQRITPPEGAEALRTRVQKDDILICITGAYTGNVAVIDFEPPKAFINQHIALLRVRPKLVVPRFLAYLLASSFGQGHFKASQYGGTKQGLGFDDIRSIPVALPALEEQQRIVSDLDREVEIIKRTTEIIEHGITKLQNHRSVLISSAVTGRIDVRNYIPERLCQ
jgi:type I restriction enzyme S subunit